MNDIKKNIDNLFEQIKSMDVYKNFKEAKKQLLDNNEIMQLINDIKRLQKIEVNTKDIVITKKIKILYKKLEKYPLYQSYKEFEDELNNELNLLSNIFNNYFKNILKL